MLKSTDLWLRQRVSGPPRVEALPNTILLCAIRTDDSFHLVKRSIATVRAEQSSGLLHLARHSLTIVVGALWHRMCAKHE